VLFGLTAAFLLWPLIRGKRGGARLEA
jgi:hypothetical protein